MSSSKVEMSSMKESDIPRGSPNSIENIKDDITRSGTVWTTSAHIITGVIGAGVLSLTWSVAQLGWIAGPCIMLSFAFITQLSASLVADCYKYPDPVTGPIRNPTYMDSVRTILGQRQIKGTLGGITSLSSVSNLQKLWKILQATGDIAFSFPYSPFLLEIQDTIKSPPSENVTMKKASMISICTTTTFYMLCAFLGYAAFGDDAPGNLLTGFGFYEPFWLVDFANACIVVHLLGAYQVFAQPIFATVENWASNRWGESKAIQKEYHIFGKIKVHPLRICWRTSFVVSTTILAILFPLFNAVLGILGAIVFWPLVVYLPIKMYIVRMKIEKWTNKWKILQCLNCVAFLVSLLTCAACIESLVKDSRE